MTRRKHEALSTPRPGAIQSQTQNVAPSVQLFSTGKKTVTDSCEMSAETDGQRPRKRDSLGSLNLARRMACIVTNDMCARVKAVLRLWTQRNPFQQRNTDLRNRHFLDRGVNFVSDDHSCRRMLDVSLSRAWDHDGPRENAHLLVHARGS